MQGLANRARRDVQFEVGQQVWLSTKHLPLRGNNSRKLAAIWAGPYEITDQISSVAFRLNIPDSWKVHNVFHVSQLKLVQGDVDHEQPVDVESGPEFEISHILDDRVLNGH